MGWCSVTSNEISIFFKKCVNVCKYTFLLFHKTRLKRESWNWFWKGWLLFEALLTALNCQYIHPDKNNKSVSLWVSRSSLVMKGHRPFFHLHWHQHYWIIQSQFSPYVGMETVHYSAMRRLKPDAQMIASCRIWWLRQILEAASLLSLCLSFFLCLMTSTAPYFLSSSSFIPPSPAHPVISFSTQECSHPSSSSPCCEVTDEEVGGSVITLSKSQHPQPNTHKHTNRVVFPSLQRTQTSVKIFEA